MSLRTPIFLDSHATTPCDPRVVEAMLPCFTRDFGNAASRQHALGWAAEELVEQARERVAALINATPREIVFTSGATESDNLAVKGAARALRGRGNHVVTTAIEHKAVLDSCYRLEKEGFEVTFVRPGGDGIVTPGAIKAALTERTVLVSVMTANNEIGTVQPVAEIGAICRARKIIFHTDAVQALAWIPCDVQAMKADMLSVSAHKMYGPKGVGALYVRRRDPRVRLEPIIDGGGHERGMRSGTLNVPGIVGLGVACEIVAKERDEYAARVAVLRDTMLATLRERIPDLRVNGSPDRRLPCNLNVAIPRIDADALMSEARDLAISSGSACTSASLEPSYVLRAMGVSDDLAQCSIRIGLSRGTTAEETEYAAARIAEAVAKLKSQGHDAAEFCPVPNAHARTARTQKR